jgi:octaprenyl-diphosphate synthase
LGAYFAHAERETFESLERYGRNLGVAFQIADDLLDVTGDENTVGKSLGTDLVKEKATLPLIRLLGQIAPNERPNLISALSAPGNHRLETLRKWIDGTDAISYARQRAMDFSQQAANELKLLPPSPAVDSLVGLTRFVVSREM